jgi:type IV pilus assembly protein PilA
MNSVKCSACGFVGWGGVVACKRCGSPLMAYAASSAGQTNSFVNYQGAGQFDAPLKTGLAISSLVIGIVNFFTLGLLGVGVVLGVTLALMALSKIKQDPSVYGGREYAIAGLVTSIVSILVIIPIGIIAAIAIPNLLASRRAANEGSAIQSVRLVASAEATYQGVHGKYGTLEELAHEGLIDPAMAAGPRRGYVVRIKLSSATTRTAGGYQVVAVPVDYPNTGRRSFFADETGVIRGGDALGKEATEFDEPLNLDNGYSSEAPTRRRRAPASEY